MAIKSLNWKKIAKWTGLSILVSILLIVGIAFTWLHLYRDEIKAKITQIASSGQSIEGLKDFLKNQSELSILLEKNISNMDHWVDLSELETFDNRIRVARADFNDAVAIYNSGWGKKFEYIMANPGSEKAPPVQF